MYYYIYLCEGIYFAIVERNAEQALDAVERAMVAVRRSQSRRTLARAAGMHEGTGNESLGSGAEVLDVIEEAEEAGDAATVTSVAAALNMDQPRASKLVAAAVAAGLVRREADQADGRRALLVRTPAGRRVSAEIHAFRRQAFGQAMTGWPDADRAEFARLLTSFVTSLSAVTR
jgi:DNA-binding MarR family transcriptional regulator